MNFYNYLILDFQFVPFLGKIVMLDHGGERTEMFRNEQN